MRFNFFKSNMELNVGRLIIFYTIFCGSVLAELTVQCEFKANDSRYTCSCINLKVIDDNTIITSVLGANRIEWKNSNVTKFLTYRDNNITYLPIGLGETFPSLVDLRLTFSDVRFVKRENFMNMTKLVQLNLTGNKIESISEETFWDLPKLEFLSLCSNEIKTLHQDLLTKLSHLKHFRADGNKIEVLQENFFTNTRELVQVWMRKGSLNSIKVDFTQFKKIQEIHLEGNLCINELFLSSNGSIDDFQKNIFANC